MVSLAGWITHAPPCPIRGVVHKKGQLSDGGIFNAGAEPTRKEITGVGQLGLYRLGRWLRPCNY